MRCCYFLFTYLLTKNFEPDLSYVENTFNEVSKYFGTLICLESTTYPGTRDIW